MKPTDDFINRYLKDLDNLLDYISKTQRENYIEEIKDHLYCFVKDKRSQGLSDEEIKQKMREEFLSPEELVIDVTQKAKLNGYIFVSIFLIVMPFFLPAYKEIPISILFFFLAYLVMKKKALWGFAAVRRNAVTIKKQNTVARIGSVYLTAVGLVILLGEWTSFQNKWLTVGLIAGCSVSFFAYVNKMQKNNKI